MSGEGGECTFRWSPLRLPEALSPRPRPMGPDLGLDQLRTPLPPPSLRFQASKACTSRARDHDPGEFLFLKSTLRAPHFSSLLGTARQVM